MPLLQNVTIIVNMIDIYPRKKYKYWVHVDHWVTFPTVKGEPHI